ncbi:taste receptor type 2 member 3-like [Rana temporaria]|uniref:taste receptor type 2 member 3-like n=1 Tax=Rana temporaria TaxID=8407 RepID=UPI001AAD293D|nr:taste receptor type 2 member 3-like [Rana temporaria]
MVLNKFIMLMNGKTWMSNKCLSTGDTIITSLCLSRWIFQCLTVVYEIFEWFLPKVHLGFFNKLIPPARLLFNYVSIWLANLLCVYYCMKITNYKNVVFLYLKVRMSRLVPWCLGLCVFFSLVSTLPYVWQSFFSQYQAGTTDVFHNMTKNSIEGDYSYLIGSTPPLVIFSIAFFLTVPSLWRHIRNMSGFGSSFNNPDMKTHYNAIKSMVAFFLLHILFITSVNIHFVGVLETGSPYLLLPRIVALLYPCLHSSVIIFYNRKLREGFLFPLTYVLSYLQKKADP